MKKGSAGGGSPAKRGGRPRREDSERKMAQLLQSAAEIFIMEGYAGTSMAKIAAAAEIGKPTIYARFGSKANLFSMVVGHILANHLVAVEECLAAGDAEAGLKRQLSSIIAASIEPMFLGLFRLFLAEAHKFPEVFAAFSAVSAGSVRSLVPHLLRVEKIKNLNAPVEEVAEMLLAMTNKLVMMESVQVDARGMIVPDREAGKIVDVILYGVLKHQ